MENKNAAPERIALPGGYSLVHEAGNAYLCVFPENHGWFRFHATPSAVRAFAAAMQPAPSESDEAVAREILDVSENWGSHEIPDAENNVQRIAAIVARHCGKPAEAALAAEVERYRQALEYYAAFKHTGNFTGPWLHHSTDFGQIARTALGYHVQAFPMTIEKRQAALAHRSGRAEK